MFNVFLRKIIDKMLRKSNQIKKSFSIIIATIGVAWFLDIFTIKQRKLTYTNRSFGEHSHVSCVSTF